MNLNLLQHAIIPPTPLGLEMLTAYVEAGHTVRSFTITVRDGAFELPFRNMREEFHRPYWIAFGEDPTKLPNGTYNIIGLDVAEGKNSRIAICVNDVLEPGEIAEARSFSARYYKQEQNGTYLQSCLNACEARAAQVVPELAPAQTPDQTITAVSNRVIVIFGDGTKVTFEKPQ